MPNQSPLTPLSLAILVTLGGGDAHGYGLLQAIEAKSRGKLSPGTGSLYAALQRLIDEGLIVESPKRPANDDDARRKYYRITSSGRQAVAAEARRLEQLLADARRHGLIPAGEGRG
jgi:DNA-binding PadR family transcriptional regulator